MWTPVVPQPISPKSGVLEADASQNSASTLSVGMSSDYRGAKIVWHGGAVFGFLTAVVLIPDKHVGFAIEINSEDREVVLGLMYELLDHYLGLPKADWPANSTGRRSNAGSPKP